MQDLEIQRGQFSSLINIYAPNKDTDQIIFYREVNENARRIGQRRTLFGEDFNLVQNQAKDN